MATQTYLVRNSSHRSVAMLLAFASAVVLSPLYVRHRKTDTRYDTSLSSGFVLPMVLAGLIVAIRAVSSSSSMQRTSVNGPMFPSLDASFVLRIGSSSWGLGGILVSLVIVLSWQNSVQEFFWR